MLFHPSWLRAGVDQPYSARVVAVVTAVVWACCVTASHHQRGWWECPFYRSMLASHIHSQTVKKVGCFLIWNFTTGASWKIKLFWDPKTDLKHENTSFLLPVRRECLTSGKLCSIKLENLDKYIDLVPFNWCSPLRFFVYCWKKNRPDVSADAGGHVSLEWRRPCWSERWHVHRLNWQEGVEELFWLFTSHHPSPSARGRADSRCY